MWNIFERCFLLHGTISHLVQMFTAQLHLKYKKNFHTLVKPSEWSQSESPGLKVTQVNFKGKFV